MRSLLVSHIYFPPQVGGITRLIQELSEAMGPQRLACLTGVPSNPETRALPSAPRAYRSPAIFSGRTKAARALAWGSTISAILVRERPRAVLLGTIYDGVYGEWLRRWFGMPVVPLVHGNELLGVLMDQAKGNPRDATHLKGADQVIANSRYTAELAMRCGVDADRVQVVYPGCDASRFVPRSVTPEFRRRVLGARHTDRVVLSIGNLVVRKGHDMVIRALAAIAGQVSDVTYVIVGDGAHRSTLETLAQDLGIRDRVVFAGRVPDHELSDYYALCDLFVMPSRVREQDCDVEGFGLVFLEANACGKAVLGGRSGGIPEAIVDGVTGKLVSPDHPEEIAQAMVKLLTDRELCARLGQAGRERVLREFGWNRVADRVHEILVGAVHRIRAAS